MPPENERRTRDADHHPLERAADKNGFAGAFNRLNAKIAQYRTLVYLVVGLTLFLGWRFEGPGARISKVETEIVAVKDSVKALRKGQDSTHNALEILVRLNCFDTTTTFNEKRLAGLDCEGIERARRQKKTAPISSIDVQRPEIAARVIERPAVAARAFRPSFSDRVIMKAYGQEPRR